MTVVQTIQEKIRDKATYLSNAVIKGNFEDVEYLINQIRVLQAAAAMIIEANVEQEAR